MDDSAVVTTGGSAGTASTAAQTPRNQRPLSGGGPNSGGGTGGSGLRSPGSTNKQDGPPSAATAVHSPLSYFGTQPDVSSRFLQMPSGDGGVQALFEAAGGSNSAAPNGMLTPEELLKLGVDRLDLPRAVSRLVVKRAQERQKQLDEKAAKGIIGAAAAAAASAASSGSSGGGHDENVRPQGTSPQPSPTSASSAGGGFPSPIAGANASYDGSDADRPIGFQSFFSVYGRHRPEETDKIRLFRLVKRNSSGNGAGSPWVLPDDITDLVWAVAETHAGWSS